MVDRVDYTDPSWIKGRASGIAVADGAFAATVGVGVTSRPPGATTWFVLKIASGGCEQAELSDELIDAIGVSATSGTWRSIQAGGIAAFMDAVANQKLSVEGDLGSFIRHLDSIIQVVTTLWLRDE